MTVIAWDGITLAADKRGINNSSHITVTKIRRIHGHLIGISGYASGISVLMDWFEKGGAPDKWPDIQKDKDRWCDMIAISPEKKIMKYEQDPIPFEIESRQYAFGSGGMYALVAMEMGLTAAQAVLMACKFDPGCGNGVDALTMDGAAIAAEHSDREFY